MFLCSRIFTCYIAEKNIGISIHTLISLNVLNFRFPPRLPECVVARLGMFHGDIVVHKHLGWCRKPALILNLLCRIRSIYAFIFTEAIQTMKSTRIFVISLLDSLSSRFCSFFFLCSPGRRIYMPWTGSESYTNQWILCILSRYT